MLSGVRPELPFIFPSGDEMLQVILIGLSIAALLGVVFEENIRVSKAKITLFCGCVAWVLLFLAAPPGSRAGIARAFSDNVGEIANLWLFLIAAMTFVVYLNKKGLIDSAIRLLLPRRISLKGLMLLTAVFCFVFSSLADNITATLVCIALVLSLGLDRETTHRFAVMVVFAVNSGGVSLISGDVTTLMIFLSGRVSMGSLLLLAIPALLSVLLLAVLLLWNLTGEVTIERRQPRSGPHTGDRRDTAIRTVDIAIAVLFLATIVGTMILNIAFEIPPVLTFLFGLSLMFLVARFFTADHEEDPILDYIRLVEFETLFFFLGVLLIVGMLQEVGVLVSIASMYQHVAPDVCNYLFGLMSALIDNVPLTAALLKADPMMSPGEWMTVTYAVGVGGSLLIIGSASGIVCMSKVPGLTVAAYARYLPVVLTAYTAGYLGALVVGSLI